MPKNPQTPQGGAPAAEATPAPAASAAVSVQERDEFVTRLIGRHGTATAALTQIAGEQLKHKRRAQAAEKLATDLQAKVPAADAVVLTGDEAKAYKDLKAKGLTLDKVPEKLTTLATLQSKTSADTRKQDLKNAAGTKYDEKVLTVLLGDTPLQFQTVNQMKEDRTGIEQVQVPHVVLKVGDKEVLEPLDTYLAREHKNFEEVLKFREGDEQGGGTSSTGGGSSSAVMPKQNSSSSSSGPKGAAADVLKTVDRVTSAFQSPGMRRKEAAGK